LALVRRTGRWLTGSRVLAGAAVAVGLFFGALVLAGGVDLALPLNRFFRVVALAGVLLPVLVEFGWSVARPLAARPSPVQVARQMEAHIPRMHNRLVSCLELVALEEPADDTAVVPPGGKTANSSCVPEGRAPSRPVLASPAFLRRLIAETGERLRGFQPGVAIDRRRLRHALIFAALALLTFGALTAALPRRFPNALARIFLPLADLPPVTGVRFEALPGDAKIPRGDNIEIGARILEGAPARLRLALEDERGRSLQYDLQKQTNGSWGLTLNGFERSFVYRIHGGGTWSRQHRVTLLDRPEIAELRAALVYPAYLRRPAPQPNPPQSADLTGPVGSEGKLTAQVKGNVTAGEILIWRAQTNAVSGLADASGGRHGGRPSSSDSTMPLDHSGGTTSVSSVFGRYPMRLVDGRWVGRFPLVGDGCYRVEFRNELGQANRAMRPGRLTALADQPPLVVIERPGGDLTLSRIGPVPLVVFASDDFGLSRLTVSALRPGSTNPVAPFVTNYPAVSVGDTAMVVLDPAGLGLKTGGDVRYFATVYDCRGQSARTQEFVVRLSPEQAAADQRLARFAAGQDVFVQRLVQLVAAQSNVAARVQGMAATYAPLVERVEAQVEERRAAPTGGVDVAEQPATDLPPLNLNPETQKMLDALRLEMAAMATQQQQAAAMSMDTLDDLKKKADEAGAIALLPADWADQMRLMGEGMQRLVSAPMRKLAATLAQGAAQTSLPPDLAALSAESSALRDRLQSMPDRFEALGQAASEAQTNTGMAAEAMRVEAAAMKADVVEDELDNLRGMLAALGERVEAIEADQQELFERAAVAPAATLPALEKKQGALDAKAEAALADVQRLQNRGAAAKPKRDPEFPVEPYTPQTEEYLVSPKEEDVVPSGTATVAAAVATAARTRKDAEEADEQDYMPALGGPEPKLDPRFADKIRPGEPAQPEGQGDPSEKRRDDVRSRQEQRLKELDMARQSVASDEQSAQSMQQGVAQRQQQMRSAAQRPGRPSPQRNAPEQQRPNLARNSVEPSDRSNPSDQAGQPGPPGKSAEARRQMEQYLQSPEVQRALALAQRMQPAQDSSASREPRQPGPGQGQSQRRLFTVAPPQELQALDPAARTVILRMQPALREEILQGLREEGPESYRPLIRNYFHELTKVKGEP
jgi:hypothetical protein